MTTTMRSVGPGTPLREPRSVGGRAFRIALVIPAGLCITFVGTEAYSILARLNLAHVPAIPWAAALAAALLWLYWRWLGGWGPPRSTQGFRRRGRRAHSVNWRHGTTAAATAAGFIFVLSAMHLGFRFSDLPPDGLRILPDGLPLATAVPLLGMLALTAGVVEEVGIRGYIQTTVEDAGAPVLAILLSAAAFTWLHAGHAWFIEQALPLFVASLWYGMLTRATDSLVPMIALHTSLDLVLFARYELAGAALPPPVADTGLTSGLALHMAIVAVSGVVAFSLVTRLVPNARRNNAE